MIFHPNTSGDVAKYFKGCFVKFPQTGEYLCTVDSVDQARIMGKIFCPDPKTGEWAAKQFQHPFDGGIEIDYVLPKKSYFNYKGKAVFLTRIPARQYRKGVCAEN